VPGVWVYCDPTEEHKNPTPAVIKHTHSVCRRTFEEERGTSVTRIPSYCVPTAYRGRRLQSYDETIIEGWIHEKRERGGQKELQSYDEASIEELET
jgi:hypothetical protein